MRQKGTARTAATEKPRGNSQVRKFEAKAGHAWQGGDRSEQDNPIRIGQLK
jgi:hypothetical protein